MPLPRQVVEKLSREPVKTPGWSGGVLIYSGALLAVVVALYIGLTFVYEPILRGQISDTESQIAALNKSISAADEEKLATYYSQISNLRSIMQKHILFSPFLTWLEAHTEANVYYSNLSFSSGYQVILMGVAKTEADVNQQLAILQAAPEVQAANVSNVLLSATDNTWQFGVSLLMKPAIFSWQQAGAASSSGQ
jgi:hypothetical protein